MTRIEIKHCPFCGGRAEMRYDLTAQRYWVQCIKPTCRVKTGICMTKNDALYRWNRRCNAD
jgi:hypothetical protein